MTEDWRFKQFSVFSALNLEIGRDEILDWRAAYYVNFGDVIDSSAVLMTWSIWRLKWSTRLQFCGLRRSIWRNSAAAVFMTQFGTWWGLRFDITNGPMDTNQGNDGSHVWDHYWNTLHIEGWLRITIDKIERLHIIGDIDYRSYNSTTTGTCTA